MGKGVFVATSSSLPFLPSSSSPSCLLDESTQRVKYVPQGTRRKQPEPFTSSPPSFTNSSSASSTPIHPFSSYTCCAPRITMHEQSLHQPSRGCCFQLIRISAFIIITIILIDSTYISWLVSSLPGCTALGLSAAAAAHSSLQDVSQCYVLWAESRKKKYTIMKH